MATFTMRIAADFLNDRIKDLVLSDKADSALKLINAGFDSNITMRDVSNLLAGKTRFIDDPEENGNYILEEFEDKEYQEEISYLFAGRYQHTDGSWYEPHIHIRSDDIVELCDYRVRGAENYSNFTERNIVANKKHLAELYFDSIGLKNICNYTNIDLESPGYSFYVGWKQCASPPLFYKQEAIPTNAIKQFLNAGKRTELIESDKRLELSGKIYSKELFENVSDEVSSGNAIYSKIREEQDLEEAKFIAQCKDIQTKVLAASKENIEIIYQARDGKSIVVNIPKEPLEAWFIEMKRRRLLMLASPDYSKLPVAPTWENISPDGLKMYNDIASHTDWLIGAGLFNFNEDWYNNEEFKHAIYDEMDKFQNKHLNFEIGVLCGSGTAIGEICFPKPNEECHGKIAVIPTASPDYFSVALSAAAVIVETGGKLAHLICVARENNKIIVRVAEALEQFKINQVVEIDAEKGKIKIL